MTGNTCTNANEFLAVHKSLLILALLVAAGIIGAAVKRNYAPHVTPGDGFVTVKLDGLMLDVPEVFTQINRVDRAEIAQDATGAAKAAGIDLGQFIVIYDGHYAKDDSFQVRVEKVTPAIITEDQVRQISQAEFDRQTEASTPAYREFFVNMSRQLGEFGPLPKGEISGKPALGTRGVHSGRKAETVVFETWLVSSADSTYRFTLCYRQEHAKQLAPVMERVKGSIRIER